MKATLLTWANRLFLVSLICVFAQLGARGCGAGGAQASHAFNILWYLTIIPGAAMWVYARFVVKDDDVDGS